MTTKKKKPVYLKPRVGQTLYRSTGQVIGKIIEVETGKNFSVTIEKPPTNVTTRITEFTRWRSRHGWRYY